MTFLERKNQDPLSEADANLDRERAAAFWVAALALFAILEIAHPPTVALGKSAGLAITAAVWATMVAYSIYLVIVGRNVRSVELTVGCFGGAIAIGVSEWLCGGSDSQLHLLFALNVIGCSAILSGRGMVAYLLVATAVVAAPLAYAEAGTPEILVSVAFTALLWCEGLLVADFGERLRAQRRVLSDAEQASKEQALTDPLTGLGNRRSLDAHLTDLGAGTEQEFAVVSLDLNGFKSYNDRFGHAAGDALLRRLGASLAASVEAVGTAFRPGGDEFCVLLDRAFELDDPVIERIIGGLSERGPGFVVTPSCGLANIPGDVSTPIEGLRLADERMYADKQSDAISAGQEMSELLLRLVAEREPDLYSHVGDVVELSESVARRLGCSFAEVSLVTRVAEQHDIGKLAVPDDVLSKPGPLDDDEWALMREHTVVGERILAGTASLRPVARVVRSSHERWDGRGYPDGLAGEDIPRSARIVAACDAYSAMTSDRNYRSAMTEDEAVSELKSCAGTQFDPQVVEALAAELASRCEPAALLVDGLGPSACL